MSAVGLIDELIHQFQLKWGSPAISLAIGTRGNIIYKNAFGNTSAFADQKVTTNHRFRVASVSKIITSIAINKLIEDGALQHETLVFGENGIIDLKNENQANLSGITVGHLLTHTSGLSGRIFNAELMHDRMSYVKQIIESNQYGRNFEPGAKYEYSNLGYVVLSQILQSVTGKDYEQWVEEYIFSPIGITGIEGASSSARLFNKTTNDWEVEYSYGSVDNSNGISWENCDDTCLSLDRAIGAGGWIARPEDLVRIMFHLEGSLEPNLLNPVPTCPNFFETPCTNKDFTAEIHGYLPGTTAVVKKDGDMIGVIVANTREGEFNEVDGYHNDILPEAIELIGKISDISQNLGSNENLWDPFNPIVELGNLTPSPNSISESTPEPTPKPEPTSDSELNSEPELNRKPKVYQFPLTKNNIKGTRKDNILKGTKKADLLDGKQGNDILNGSRGNDVLKGDRGNDTLNGSKGNDYLDGSKGIDILTGGKGADVFQISKGVDLVKDFSIKQGDRIALDNKGKYTFSDGADGVLVMASSKKQLLLEGVDRGDIIALGIDLFVQPI